jgi:hypothetical protein
MDLKYAIEVVRGHYVYAETIELAIATARMHADSTIRAIDQGSKLLTFSDDHVTLNGECVPQCYCCVRVVGRFVDVLERREEALKRTKGKDGTPEGTEPRCEPSQADSLDELERNRKYSSYVMQQRMKSMQVLARMRPEDLK